MIRSLESVTLAATLAFATLGEAAPPRVQIKEFKFVPVELSVPVGTTVTWTNGDDEAHTVTATDRAYTSTAMERAESFAHRFNAPGAYTYFCALHPHMIATVVVR